MRAQSVIQATAKRLANPLYWGMILLFCALWALLAVALNGVDYALRHALPPIHLWFIAVMLGPVPWQWSGNDRCVPTFLRGFTQALVWNAVLILGAMMLSQVLAPRFQPSRMVNFVQPQRPSFPLKNQRTGGPSVPGYLTLMAGLLAGWLVANRERAEKAEGEAQRAALAARMHVLQAQMNPHVLFNIISGFCEMAREKPEAMERALLDLAGFLRELLDYSDKDLVPLSQGRALMERYLRLEQIRLGRRLSVRWDWDPALESAKVPPLLLQPMVENAIKHGIAPNREGGELLIRLSGSMESLELEVANTGAGLAVPHEERVGLRNARERLAFFDPQATLRLFQDGDWTRVVLRTGGHP